MKLVSCGLVGVLSFSILTGCNGLDPDSPEAKRQKIFQQMLRNSEDIGGMLRGRIGWDEQRLRNDIQNLQTLANQPWPYFSDANSPLQKKSRAKPDIWTDAEGYRQAIAAFQQAVDALETSAQQTPLAPDHLIPAAEALETSCKNCHQQYRSL